MINAFFEVLKDLWLFVLGKEPQEVISHKVLVPIKKQNTVSSVALRENEPEEIKFDLSDYNFAGSQKAYVRIDNTPCLLTPNLSFDTQVGRLNYGEELIIDDVSKNFVHVQSLNFSGWVETAFVTENKYHILPNFKSGYVYSETSTETIKLRTFIGDESLGGELGLALRTEEYILFKLKQKGIRVSWRGVRPRLAGDWKTILKGVRGASIKLEPHTGSVLEMVDQENSGFLAIVEEVRPDNSIKITGVAREREGEYREEVLTHAEWREWRPVFITFT